jgi:hypothetical protein
VEADVMLLRCTVLAFVLLSAPAIQAGTVYKVTSKMGDKTITYEVRFGGTRLNDHMTAFDPASKKFVYLTWSRRGKKPEPAAVIWDHATGKNIELYKFPDAKNPLPVIPSIGDMKVCPMTGDKAFKAKATIAVD